MSSEYYVEVHRRVGTEVTKERVPRRNLQSAEKYLEINSEYADITRMVICKRAKRRDTVIKEWAKGLA